MLTNCAPYMKKIAKRELPNNRSDLAASIEDPGLLYYLQRLLRTLSI